MQYIILAIKQGNINAFMEAIRSPYYLHNDDGHKAAIKFAISRDIVNAIPILLEGANDTTIGNLYREACKYSAIKIVKYLLPQINDSLVNQIILYENPIILEIVKDRIHISLNILLKFIEQVGANCPVIHKILNIFSDKIKNLSTKEIIHDNILKIIITTGDSNLWMRLEPMYLYLQLPKTYNHAIEIIGTIFNNDMPHLLEYLIQKGGKLHCSVINNINNTYVRIIKYLNAEDQLACSIRACKCEFVIIMKEILKHLRFNLSEIYKIYGLHIYSHSSIIELLLSDTRFNPKNYIEYLINNSKLIEDPLLLKAIDYLLLREPEIFWRISDYPARCRWFRERSRVWNPISAELASKYPLFIKNE